MSVPAGDMVFLVLWFKEGLTTPIYSYDVRELLSGQPKHWWDSKLLGQRAYFHDGNYQVPSHILNDPTGVRPGSHLLLEDLASRDAGRYKCRVDFQRAATRNTRVDLTVVVSPKRLSVTDSRGRQIHGAVDPPITEGEELRISCTTLGGRPPPRVIWYMNGDILDEEEEEQDEEETINTLTIVSVSRLHLMAQLTCRASNNNLSRPLEQTITLDMNLGPVDVTIQHQREPISAGRTYDMMCMSKGSRPPAVLTWWRGASRITDGLTEATTQGNITRSKLSLVPLSSDDGQLLSCRAEHPTLASAVMEDTWKLQVYYVPRVRVAMGRSLDPHNIREGDDVYFECHVAANPKAYKVIWLHNGSEVREDKDNGVILTNQSLVLQNVKRWHGGDYQCQASNVEGDANSDPLRLKVQFVPVCMPSQVKTYGVSSDEDVHIACHVDAVPQITDFLWYLNTTSETLAIPKQQYTVEPNGSSVVTYVPYTEQDFGTLLCLAENPIGRQAEPCVFQIVPATVPGSPVNCSLHNISATQLSITCSGPKDATQELKYLMELYGTKTGQLIANHTNKVPRFVVRGLGSEAEVEVVVYSVTSAGRSVPVTLATTTMKLPVKQLETRSGGNGQEIRAPGPPPGGVGMSLTTPSVLGALGGVLLVLLCIIIVSIFIVRTHCRRQPREDQEQISRHIQSESQQKLTQKQHPPDQGKHEKQHLQQKQQQQPKQDCQSGLEKSPPLDPQPQPGQHGAYLGIEAQGYDHLSHSMQQAQHPHHPGGPQVHHHQHIQDGVNPDIVPYPTDPGSSAAAVVGHGLSTLGRGSMGTINPLEQQQHQLLQHQMQQQHHHHHQIQQQQQQHQLQHQLQQQQQHHPHVQHLLQQSPPQHHQHPQHYTAAVALHCSHPGSHTVNTMVCSQSDMGAAYSSSLGDSCPPHSSPSSLPPLPLVMVGESAPGTPGPGRALGLTRIPEVPESPSGPRRESSV